MNKTYFKKLFSDLCCSNCGHDFDEDSEEEEKRNNILNLLRFLDIASDGLKFKDNIPNIKYSVKCAHFRTINVILNV